MCIARQLARQIENFDPKWFEVEGGPERFEAFSRMLDREHRVMLALARSMRLTHQSQLDRAVAGKEARLRAESVPWEVLR